MLRLSASNRRRSQLLLLAGFVLRSHRFLYLAVMAAFAFAERWLRPAPPSTLLGCQEEEMSSSKQIFGWVLNGLTLLIAVLALGLLLGNT